ncbi:MAG: hypothetical protein AVDCRST_MAG28-669 [uncultured Rubrobacteraceae bacterium]|uniref:Uncharacterized protein n=1 Tax=uncultured Rubrobacteraceae bacterium TaxID=349277 RepID=A0A6J4QT07_9ACTN|nr:MAG: hypothetical protein AVDCRST_MAG28-669 [uncultured Rubrobacteraceae bacterium]
MLESVFGRLTTMASSVEASSFSSHTFVVATLLASGLFDQ